MSDPDAPRPPQTLHLRPTADLAERVLLPGDPGRALALAQTLLDAPRMFNHNRGLWGYTGEASDGQPITIQATGIGGPSAAIILSELIALGARRAIRVGTCGALSPELELGDLVIACESICADGTSAALGAGERAAADGPLTERLRERAEGARAGTVVSVDLFYDAGGRGAGVGQAGATGGSGRALGGWRSSGALAVEMEAATLFALGARAGVPVACLLTVSDTFDERGARSRIDDHSLLAAAEQMGGAAIAALTV